MFDKHHNKRLLFSVTKKNSRKAQNLHYALNYYFFYSLLRY